ncbi:50S ribosomal protein L4 [Candidatus Kuenenbacteria bacterium]|nr:50S ribosomal protein L4 [Candidatus Kuenenbacteria bacterium]
MIKAKLYNQQGEDKGEVNLKPEIFEVAVKQDLVHQVVIALLANRRQILAHTKDKSEVRGGGRKPWKQKGTGRARHGSIRSPLWKGGGVTFGPTNQRNFTKQVNKKMRVKALFMVLSDKAKDSAILVMEKFELPEIKTKQIVELLKKIKLEKKVLFVIEKMDENIACSIKNIPKIDVISADSLNVYDLINSNHVVFTKDALKKIEEVYIK